MDKNNSRSNAAFYTKKRGLLRKAEQIQRYCDSDVFIIIQKHDTGRVFSYTTHQDFDLTHVSKLIQKDVCGRVQVKKAQKIVRQDFDQINQRIQQIQTILNQQDVFEQTFQESDTAEDQQEYYWQDTSHSNGSSEGPCEVATEFLSPDIARKSEEDKYELQSKISQADIESSDGKQYSSASTCQHQNECDSASPHTVSCAETTIFQLSQSKLPTPRHSEALKSTDQILVTSTSAVEAVVGEKQSDLTKEQSPTLTDSSQYLNTQSSSYAQSPQHAPNDNDLGDIQKSDVHPRNDQTCELFDFNGKLTTLDFQQTHYSGDDALVNNIGIDCQQESILDCDDIIMFNNWDDVRQDNTIDNNFTS